MKTTLKIWILLISFAGSAGDVWGQDIFRLADSIKLARSVHFKSQKIKSVKTIYYRAHKQNLDSVRIFTIEEYDTLGNIIKLIRPDNTSPFLHGPLFEDSAYYYYNSQNWNVETVKFERGRVTDIIYRYNESGQKCEELEYRSGLLHDSSNFKYDFCGNITEETSYYPIDSAKYTLQYYYNLNNKLIKRLWTSDDKDTLERTVINYDFSKGIIKEVNYNKEWKPTYTKIVWYNKSGLKIREKYWFSKNIFEDEIHYTDKYYFYDNWLRLSSETEFDNGELHEKRFNSYNIYGLVIQEYSYDLTYNFNSVIKTVYEYY